MERAIERRVQRFILEKNNVANIGHAGAYAVLLTVTNKYLEPSFYTYIYYSLVAMLYISTAVRWYGGYRAFKYCYFDAGSRFSSYYRLHQFGVWSQVVSWSATGLYFFYQFSLLSVPSLLTLVVLSAITAGATTSLGLEKKAFAVYCFFMLAPAFVMSILTAEQIADYFISGFIVLFAVFIMNTAKLFRQYVRISVENEKSIYEEKEQLRSFVEAVPGLVAFFDSNSQVQNMNTQFQMVYAKTNIKDIVSKFQETGRNEDMIEMEIDMQGRMEWHLINFKRVHEPKSGVFVLGFSIAELKTAQKELEDQKMRAQVTSRVSSLGEMAGGIAHEINNPLAILSGKVALMKKIIYKNDHEKMIEITESMDAVVRRIAAIVKGMRSLMGDASQEMPALTDVKKLVRETVELVRGRMTTHSIELHMNFDEVPLEIWLRPVQISQVVVNLVNNAIYVAKDLDEKWIRIHVQSNGEQIEISVVDSGKGIPQDIRDKIMNPFFTTKPPGEGTGLGLSISRNIMQTHGGEFSIDEKSPNTCFVLRMPISGASSEPSKKQAA